MSCKSSLEQGREELTFLPLAGQIRIAIATSSCVTCLTAQPLLLWVNYPSSS